VPLCLQAPARVQAATWREKRFLPLVLARRLVALGDLNLSTNDLELHCWHEPLDDCLICYIGGL
jgi:hypothetical protein